MSTWSEETGGGVAGTAAIDGGSPEAALFVHDGSSFGVGRPATGQDPVWIPFTDITAVDEIGEPGADGPTVEIATVGGRLVVATFPQAFCDGLVEALLASVEQSVPAPAPATTPLPPRGANPFAPAPVPAMEPAPVPAMEPAPAPAMEPAPLPAMEPAPLPAMEPAPAPAMEPAPVPVVEPLPTDEQEPAVEVVPPVEVVPVVPVVEPADSVFATTSRGALPPERPLPSWLQDPAEQAAAGGTVIGSESALVIENVTYLGGHPSAKRKRKKCIGTLTRESLELTGRGVSIQIPWSDVISIEAQNPDEARFRISTRIQSESTALVVQQRDGSTVLLEAHSCPKIPLQGAISQLVAGVGVVVV